jgi:hypothetical protein
MLPLLVGSENLLPRRRDEDLARVAVASSGDALRNRKVQQARICDPLGNASIEEDRAAPFRGLLKDMDISGEQEFAEFRSILPGRCVAAEPDLLSNDLTSGLVDAKKPACPQRLYNRRLAAA